MNHSGRNIIFCLLVVIGVLLWWMTLSPNESEKPQLERVATSASLQGVAVAPLPTHSVDEKQKKEQALEQVTQSFNTPIAFYGRVIDQNNNPVADARIGYSPIDNFLSSNTSYSGMSDAEGYFSIDGIKGIAHGVGVTKEGYYPVNDEYDKSPSSSGVFAYGIGPDSVRRAAPTKDNPAIFVLHKQGEAEPLIYVDRLKIGIPKTGQPVRIDLTRGKAGSGDLRIESWTGEKMQNHFDWKYRLSVEGGGIVERKERFDFAAPNDGYETAVEVGFSKNSDQWSDRLTRDYFLKLADGRYARFSVRLFAGGINDEADRNWVVLESYVNPTPGSRNLEFDPAKAIDPRNP